MRIALVIGLQSYDSLADGGLGRLAGPHLGASRIHQRLESAGFNSTLHQDIYDQPQSSRQGLYGAIQDFRKKLALLAKQGDKEIVAFFYYSGHGGYNGKHQYLLPRDSKRDIDADVQGIDFEDNILHHMAQHASLSIAVLDCCRTGDAYHQGAVASVKAPPGHQYLVCYACPPCAKAPDNGMYTNALLQHIFKSDRSFLELLGEANNEVVATGGQEPQWVTSFSFPPGFVLVNQVGWRFVQNKDIEGCDLAQAPGDDADGIVNAKLLARAAEGHGLTAAAFNTLGHIKHTADDLVDMPAEHGHPEPVGIFVRDARVPRGWLYFPEMDSYGMDMPDVPNMEGNVFQMALKAAEQGAVAFNTDGWAKEYLRPFEEWWNLKSRPVDGMRGIFVRVSGPPAARPSFS